MHGSVLLKISSAWPLLHAWNSDMKFWDWQSDVCTQFTWSQAALDQLPSCILMKHWLNISPGPSDVHVNRTSTVGSPLPLLSWSDHAEHFPKKAGDCGLTSSTTSSMTQATSWVAMHPQSYWKEEGEGSVPGLWTGLWTTGIHVKFCRLKHYWFTSFCLGHALPKLAIQTRKKTWQQAEVKGQLQP